MVRFRIGGRALVAAASVVLAALAAPGVVAAGCWRPPVAASVGDPFRPPSCPWCPGNRGIEYATTPGEVVTAVASGRVSFAGSVAGTTYVVVTLADGRRVTYGRLLARRHDAGDVVLSGQVVGRADAAFHFGVRVGDEYVDPAPLLGRLVGRPRLLPLDGSPAPPAPPPTVRCSWSGSGGVFSGRTR